MPKVPAPAQEQAMIMQEAWLAISLAHHRLPTAMLSVRLIVKAIMTAAWLAEPLIQAFHIVMPQVMSKAMIT